MDSPTPPSGHIPLEQHYHVVQMLTEKYDADLIALRDEVAELRAQLAKVVQTPFAIIIGDDDVRNAIATTIRWVGKATAAAILIGSLAWTGYEMAYGDVSIGRRRPPPEDRALDEHGRESLFAETPGH